MLITSFQEQVIGQIPFLNAGKGPGSFTVDELPIHIAKTSAMPGDLDAIVVTSDLQGRECFEENGGGPPRLLGEVLPDRLCNEFLAALGVVPSRVGALLAGDFYTVPALDKLGGTGDVTDVWRAFATAFRWVAGVAGNHDTFGQHTRPLKRIATNVHYLDGTWAELGGLRIAGIGGIIGNPRKTQRKAESSFVDQLESLLRLRPDVLVMHDGPDCPEAGLRGSAIVRETLERFRPPLVVRGHAHWRSPLARLKGDTQVLNVDCRVVIILPE